MGMVGVGKTTYVAALAEELASEAFYESVDENPILEKFYQEPEKYSFMSQVYYLATRFAATKKASAYPRYLLDRTMHEDILFAEVNYALGRMTDDEKVVYDTLASTLIENVNKMGKPNLYIYLRASFDTILKRIVLRNREFEQDKSLVEYYRALHTRYDAWVTSHIAPNELLIIDADKYDINIPADKKEVLSQIRLKMQALGV